MPACCSTAPSVTSFQWCRSGAWVIIARLRISAAGIGASFAAWQSSTGGERFLLGEGALDLVLQQLGQCAAQPFRYRREQVARPRQRDWNDTLDPPRPRGEHDD